MQTAVALANLRFCSLQFRTAGCFEWQPCHEAAALSSGSKCAQYLRNLEHITRHTSHIAPHILCRLISCLQAADASMRRVRLPVVCSPLADVCSYAYGVVLAAVMLALRGQEALGGDCNQRTFSNAA